MESIMSNERICYVCGSTQNLHKHHIFGGSNRKTSDKEGCWVYLCGCHHNLSDHGVHYDKELDLRLKRECQAKWEVGRGRAEFLRTFMRSYL